MLFPLREHLFNQKVIVSSSSDEIEKKLRAMEDQRRALTRQIEESEQVLFETDRKIADFKRRQNLRIANEPIEDEHKQRISEAGNESAH